MDGGSTLDAAQRAASAVGCLAGAIGIPKGLSEYGLREDHVSDVVDEAMKSGNVAVNPRTDEQGGAGGDSAAGAVGCSRPTVRTTAA